jgi:hypothetical protein
MRVRKVSDTQGLSLLELLIASFLFGLVSVMVAFLVRAGYQYLRQTEQRADLQRASLFVMSGLSRELVQSSVDTIRYSGPSDPAGLVFASPRGTDGMVSYTNNRLEWKRWTGVYWDQSRSLLLQVEQPFPSPTIFKPDPSTLGQDKSVSYFAGLPSPRILARNVTDFTVDGDREVRLTLQTEVKQGDKRSRLTTRTAVRPYH